MSAYNQKKIEVMAFSQNAAKRCVCRVVDGVGYDAFDGIWQIVTDDYGDVVFVRNQDRYQKSWRAKFEE